jgi:hypothetical protein
VERNAEAKRSGDADPPRAPCSGVIPCIAMQGAGLRGRVGVVAERRLGGERSGKEVSFRVVEEGNSMREGGRTKRNRSARIPPLGNRRTRIFPDSHILFTFSSFLGNRL